VSWYGRLFGMQTRDNLTSPQVKPPVKPAEWKVHQITPRLEARLPEEWSQHPPPNALETGPTNLLRL
jgi:hypothetical protein